MRFYSLRMLGGAGLLFAFTWAGLRALDAGLYVSASVAFALAAVAVLSICTLQMRLARTLRDMVSLIRYEDAGRMPRTTYRSRLLQELADELAETFEALKRRIGEENTRLKFYEQLLEQVNFPVFVTDRKGTPLWQNRATSEAIGPTEAALSRLALSAARGKRVVRTTWQGRPAELALTANAFSVGGRDLWLLSCKDIGDVLEEKELAAWQKLIRVLTHEVMNSLTPILSLTETVADRTERLAGTSADAALIHQALCTIQRRSEGLLQFVENYRRLTRLPAPTLAPVAVDDMMKDMKALFPGSSITWRATPRGITIHADRAQIEQVLINLLKNACEATGDKLDARVNLSFFRRAGEGDHFVVEDNGPGMRPEVAEQAFIPFFTTKEGGSGIGLSLCRQIVRLHGGHIRMTSAEGKGTQVDFMLPLPPTAATPGKA